MIKHFSQLAAALASVGCSAETPAQQLAQRDASGSPTACPLCEGAKPLTGQPPDYDDLLASIGDSQVVALGENTHGTHEFYRERARITERLVREKGFRALIIEGDWPDTDRVNRYVRGMGEDRSATQALRAFQDFPRWMWRNADFAALVERLRAYNQTLPEADRVGVYGMDVYNMFGAMDAVRQYAGQRDPQLERRVQDQYRCFARYRRDPEAYGSASRSASRSCAEEARTVLELVAGLPTSLETRAREDLFSARRSAASVVGAEEYHRANFSGSNSWNVRDRRMVANIEDIARHVGEPRGTLGKVVVWAHNSHVGDARATDAPLRGELNVGQLLRESMGDSAYLVGLFTHGGTVMAAAEWGAAGLVQKLRPALPESYSGVFHAAGLRNSFLDLRSPSSDSRAAAKPLLQRAVGVIYQPQSERVSHYFRADIAQQFDAVLFFSETRALKPL